MSINRLISIVKQLKANGSLNKVTQNFTIEVDCIKIGNMKASESIQSKLISDLQIFKNEIKVVRIENEIYTIEYKGNTLFVQYISDTTGIDNNFTTRIQNSTKGIILVNNYDTFNNEHISVLASNTSRKFERCTTNHSLTLTTTDVILTNFNCSVDSYEAINDLLNQGKMIIISIDKYTIYDIITKFTKSIPIEYRHNIVHNIIGCYIYYIMPLDRQIVNDYVVGMFSLKNDILKGRLTPGSIHDAQAAFKEELSTTTDFNSENITENKLNEIISRAIKMGCSDITLTSGSKPKIRVNKQLKDIDDEIVLTSEILQNYSQIILKTDALKIEFEEKKQADAAYSIPGIGRFRTSLYKQKNSVAISLRSIPENAWNIEKAGVPDSVIDLFNVAGSVSNTRKAKTFNDGLILITGPVNTGKSTTMNALIDYINENKHAKIITIEDPVESIHKNKKSIIEQREIGIDCISYEDGLKQALRSDPDVVSVGEMRTHNAADTLLKAARSGHLAFSTFHTPTVIQTLQSFLQMFPENSRELVRSMLAEFLRMIYCQKLLPRKNGGLVAAQEILLNIDAVRAIIGNPSAKLADLENVMISNASEGMITMDKSIANLYLNDTITLETALKNAVNKKMVEDIIQISRK